MAEEALETTAKSLPRQSPTSSHKHTCPVEHTHAHPRASTYPQTRGEETEDPCDTPCGFPPMPLSHLYRLVGKQDVSGQTRGSLRGLPGGRGTREAQPIPISVTHWQAIVNPWGGSPQVIQQFCKGAARECVERHLTVCLCLFILWD